MKIYVAGKFEKKEEILRIYELLKKKGHSIAYDWTTHKPIKPYTVNKETASQYSENEMRGIIDSDVFIFLSDEKGTTLNMEFGASIILKKLKGKPLVYVVGEFNDKSPWFFNKDVIRKDNIDEVLKEL